MGFCLVVEERAEREGGMSNIHIRVCDSPQWEATIIQQQSFLSSLAAERKLDAFQYWMIQMMHSVLNMKVVFFTSCSQVLIEYKCDYFVALIAKQVVIRLLGKFNLCLLQSVSMWEFPRIKKGNELKSLSWTITF